MIRKKLTAHSLIGEKYFNWRGGDVSRIEALSDGIFAIAIALLVVSLEVPKSFDALLQVVEGFAAFAITLTAIISIWYGHFIFFRRYGFESGYIIALNTALLFVVLFYIYPLKFLTSLLVTQGVLGKLFGLNVDQTITMENSDWPILMLIYSLGFLAVFLVFTLFYHYAYLKRAVLSLNPIETLLTKSTRRMYLILSCFAILSIILTFSLGDTGPFFGGVVYWFVGPVLTLHGFSVKKKQNALLQINVKKGD